jgi:hypothetical protein
MRPSALKFGGHAATRVDCYRLNYQEATQPAQEVSKGYFNRSAFSRGCHSCRHRNSSGSHHGCLVCAGHAARSAGRSGRRPERFRLRIQRSAVAACGAMALPGSGGDNFVSVRNDLGNRWNARLSFVPWPQMERACVVAGSRWFSNRKLRGLQALFRCRAATARPLRPRAKRP